MEKEKQDFIISEFEKQRKEIFESTAPKDDFKIIQNIAHGLNINFHEVLNIIENKKTIMYNSTILSHHQLDKLKKNFYICKTSHNNL